MLGAFPQSPGFLRRQSASVEARHRAFIFLDSEVAKPIWACELDPIEPNRKLLARHERCSVGDVE